MRLRQVILQAADFKPKHRPLSLARNVRLSVWLKSNACRPCLQHRQTCNSKFFRCSSMRMQRKIPLRHIVLDRTTAVCTGGTTTTTGQSVAPWPDPKFTMDMRNATTHEGTGGNPNVGVPVGFVRPPPFSWSSPSSLSTCPPCSRADTCLSLPSLGSSVRHTTDPYEDTCARASPASLLRPKSEGTNSALVRESEAAFVSPQVSSLPTCLVTCLSPTHTSLARPNPFFSP